LFNKFVSETKFILSKTKFSVSETKLITGNEFFSYIQKFCFKVLKNLFG